MLKGKVWEAAVKATVLIVIWQNGDLPLSPSATENGEESRKCETVPVFPDPTMFSSNFHHYPFDNNQLIAFKLKISTTTLWVSLWCNAVSWKVIICLSYQKADLHSSIYLRRQNNKKKAGGEAFFGQSNFCKRHKEDKGNSSVSVYPDVPCRGLYLPFFVLLCSKLPEKLSTNPFLFSFWTPK